ncbi:ATP-dependent DNA helicase DinG [Halobacillus salinarum]|uniref:3'-5' exonuclease DinG n=1 Tax=Halobacillus salinarum TaxID=2932257 RepID=A0ABY4EH12_9BACI|nr:ATP-dependent DNA helicase DinG [Halobacillus salinarum]UOQ42737.1 ATP-dependent DNA helicase DinG [Halobacillus salinarum]
MTKFAIFDLETTGNAASKGDRIIEIGIVILQDGKKVQEFSSLVYPEREIPPFITSLTGIKEEDVLDAPLFNEIAEEVHQLFNGACIVAHNIEFDLSFINEEFKLSGLSPLHNPVVDTVELARIMLPSASSFKLGQLAQELGILHGTPHRALADAQVTSSLLQYLLEKMRKLPERTLIHLLKVESKLKSNLYGLLKDAIDVHRYESSDFKEFELWQGIPVRQVPTSILSNASQLTGFQEWIAHAYEAPKGLSSLMNDYEPREGQKRMSQAVYEAFTQNKHAFIEAGAGAGKSVAYLLSALYYACNHKERVVISTHTTSLQQQLLKEEIPKVEKLFNRKVNAAVFKGKSHYISLSHFSYELERSHQDNYDEALTKAILLVWLTETVTGDADEIQLPSSGQQFWHKVSAEQAARIPSVSSEQYSFYRLALMKAEQADLIITNHSLFCMDLMSEEERLPEYARAVIDEAHHFESIASRQFGLQFSYTELQRQLSQFNELFHVQSWGLTGETNQLIFSGDECRLAIEGAKEELNAFSRYMFQQVKRQNQGKAKSDIGRIQYLLPQAEPPAFLEVAAEMLDRFTAKLNRLNRGIEQIINQLEPRILLGEKAAQIISSRFSSQKNSLESWRKKLKEYFNYDQNQVKWIEIDGDGAANVIFLFSEPMDLAENLQTQLFMKKKSIVLTSATLTTHNSFNYMKGSMGFNKNAQLLELSIPSPYQFNEHVQLMVPDDFPDIKQNEEEFILALGEAVYSLAQVTKGRMLVLFTSYTMLKKTYQILKECIDPEEFMIFAQGVSSGSRERLKKNFQAFDQSILLGTSSFWEGVDIPGDDLACVVIARLPFQPPDQPLQKVRDQQLKSAGRNGFMERSLPQAIIRFKQGFGRLIRSKKDRGIVFVCDKRLMEAKYGKYFLSSIPQVPVHYQSTSRLIKRIEKWL